MMRRFQQHLPRLWTAWRTLSIPIRVGLAFGFLGMALTVVGIVRGNVPLNPASIGMALLIGGGSWFVVAWAVAAAAVDVEQDVAEGERLAEVETEPEEAG